MARNKKGKALNMDEKVTIYCYRQKDVMKRGEAIDFYFEAMVYCDGSERERYTNIYQQLMMGFRICKDDFEF